MELERKWAWRLGWKHARVGDEIVFGVFLNVVSELVSCNNIYNSLLCTMIK